MANDFNHFNYAPTGLTISRASFDLSHSHKTSFNAGGLIPFKCFEVMPGDTFSLDQSVVCRMSTPIFPTMDNAYLDVYWFFVPTRLVWDHTKEFYGENTSGPWDAAIEYEIPMSNMLMNAKGSSYHQLGIPYFDIMSVQGDPLEFSDLPIRCYGLVWNEWFRNQNVSSPLVIDTGDSGVPSLLIDSTRLYQNTDDTILSLQWKSAGLILPVAKFADRFTSSLPEPQKGPAVELPFSENAQVYGLEDNGLYVTAGGTNGSGALGLLYNEGGSVTDGVGVRTPSGDTFSGAGYLNLATKEQLGLINSGLYADLTSASSISVNVVRQMFAMQRLYELDARSGTRFREILKAHFGVTVADERVQVPEFLAGRRIPISMTSVPQTSATSDVSPQGNLSAYSHTMDKNSMFTYSVTEPGYIMGVCCVRTNQTYSQGLSRMWTRKRRFDFYWPNFANLGEQPVYNGEVYAAASKATREEVFGYQEAWSEYRQMQNTVSGMLDPAYETSSPWTYAERLSTTPTLSPAFIYQGREALDRTLAVSSSVEDQFIADFYFKITAVRPMPIYSIPGLEAHF